MAEGSNWLKYGCFGCLGIVVLVAIIVVAVFGVAAMQVRGEQIESPTLRHEATAAQAVSADADDTPRGSVTLRVANGGFQVLPGEISVSGKSVVLD